MSDDVFHDLRAQVLGLSADEVGLEPADGGVFGAVMETGFPEGVATLVALIDGTTSLYLSSGGGTIGGGEHEQVAQASIAFVRAVAAEVEQLQPSDDDGLPGDGRVILRALTTDGIRAIEADEEDLGEGRHALSPVFHAAHEVIGRLRELDEG